MEYKIAAGQVLTDNGWENEKIITIKDGIIADIEEAGAQESLFTDEHIAYLTPGVIDNHLHGGEGYDILEGNDEKMAQWLVQLAENGVAAVLSGPHTDTNEAFRRCLSATQRTMDKQKNGTIGGAVVLGVHLEGPFISPVRPGAMKPECIQKPTVANYKRLVEGYEDIIREVSLAPEEDERFELTRYLKERNIRVLAGHTNCDYETALAAFEAGLSGICHTFNAARPINHRDPGVLVAALDNPEVYCEYIGDHVHLHPGILKLIYRCKGKEKAMLISDAVQTTNLPDGIYGDRGRQVQIKNGTATLYGTNTIAGSGQYGTYSVKKMVESGFEFENVIVMAAETPAAWLGLDNWAVKVGNPAIFSFWNEEYEPEGTWILNRRYQKNT